MAECAVLMAHDDWMIGWLQQLLALAVKEAWTVEFLRKQKTEQIGSDIT